MAKNHDSLKKRGIDTTDLNDEQQDMLKDIMTKEIMKKIEKRINNQDGEIMKTLKAMIDDNEKPRRK